MTQNEWIIHDRRRRNEWEFEWRKSDGRKETQENHHPTARWKNNDSKKRKKKKKGLLCCWWHWLWLRWGNLERGQYSLTHHWLTLTTVFSLCCCDRRRRLVRISKQATKLHADEEEVKTRAGFWRQRGFCCSSSLWILLKRRLNTTYIRTSA